MVTTNPFEGNNGTAAPEELKEFAQRMGWEKDRWQEYPISTAIAYDLSKDEASFYWQFQGPDNTIERTQRIVLKRAKGLPAWVRRRYYVSELFSAPLTEPTHFCAVYESGQGVPTEYTPEKP